MTQLSADKILHRAYFLFRLEPAVTWQISVLFILITEQPSTAHLDSPAHPSRGSFPGWHESFLRSPLWPQSFQAAAAPGPAGRVNLPVLIKIAPFVALCVPLSPVLGTSLCSADSEGQISGGNGGVKHYFFFLMTAQKIILSHLSHGWSLTEFSKWKGNHDGQDGIIGSVKWLCVKKKTCIISRHKSTGIIYSKWLELKDQK